jgi:hypothetical protein
MIKRLVIHRFRGIREGVLEDLGKVNLLVGPNNSGKTAILELIYLTGVSKRPCGLVLEDGTAFTATAPEPYDFLGFAPLSRLRQRHGHREKWKDSPVVQTKEGGLAVTLVDLPDSHPLHKFRLAAPLPEEGHTKGGNFTEDDLSEVVFFSLDRQKDVPSDMIPDGFVEQGVKAEESRWYYLWQPEWIYQWDRQKPIDALAVWAENRTMWDSERVLLFDFHNVHGHFTKRFVNWAYENVPDWYEQVAESLIRVFPAMKDAKTEVNDAPDGQRGKTGHIRFPGRTPLPVDHFGDGTRHAFKVLASLIALTAVVDDKHPGLFLWEDPELFMHPESLGQFIKEVLNLVKDKPIQMLISTQSMELLAWIGKMMEENHLKSEYVRTYTVDLSDGELIYNLFEGRDFIDWLSSGFDPRERTGKLIDILPLSWRLKTKKEKDEVPW